MDFTSRWLSGKYVSVVVKCDGTTIDLGVLTTAERRELRDTLKDAYETLTDD